MSPNPLDQYRNLLAEHGAIAAGHTAPAISHARATAAEMLLANSNLVLPGRGDGYVSPADMFAPDLGVNLGRVPATADVNGLFRCGVPAVSTLLGVTVNDTFRPTDTLLRLLPDGVTVTAFSQADPAMARVIERYYGTLAPAVFDDTAGLMNTALAQDGVLVYIGRGVHADRPIQLLNILRGMTPVLAVRRLLIVAEADSRATLLVCDHDSDVATGSASTAITEVILGKGASLDLYTLEESSPATSRYSRIAARQDADSRLGILVGTLRPTKTRNEVTVRMAGPGASLALNGMTIAGDASAADCYTRVLHDAPHCHSRQVFKYLADGTARTSFDGLIRVGHGAIATEAHQTCRGMLVSPTARIHTQPQLEIYCDDVKCSHGAATGQLDERALFYMLSRGIDPPQARSMLMNAFMADVIDSVTLTPLRDRLRHLVERRLSGDDAFCEGCDL